MIIIDTFNNINKFIKFVVLLYVPYRLECMSPINATLHDFELISQLNQFSDTNIANAVIQNIENNLDYINLSLQFFAIFDQIIPLRNI